MEIVDNEIPRPVGLDNESFHFRIRHVFDTKPDRLHLRRGQFRSVGDGTSLAPLVTTHMYDNAITG